MRISTSTTPPAIIIHRSTTSKSKWGYAYGPFISIPHDAPEHLKAHELMHVKQWLVVSMMSFVTLLGFLHYTGITFELLGLCLFVNSALKWLSNKYVFKTEAAAYGTSVKHQPEDLNRFSSALHGSEYNTGRTYKECKQMIEARASDGRWF
jgi:hypothetical protein